MKVIAIKVNAIKVNDIKVNKDFTLVNFFYLK